MPRTAAPSRPSRRRRPSTRTALVAGAAVAFMGTVVFLTFRGGGGDAPPASATPTTTTTTPLASDADQYELAYLSTDGTGTTVFLTDGKGSGTDVVAKLEGQAEALQWSPDGTRLLLDGDASGDFELQVVDVATGAVTALAPSPASNEGGAAWSPDGDRVVFFSDREGGFAGYVVDAAGGEPTRVTPTDLPAVTDLSFSPDGTEIAFATSTGVDSSTWIVGSDGTGAREVGDLDGATQPAWSPDGTRLAVSAQPAGSATADIFLLDPATGDAAALAATGYLDAFPTWSSDGRWVHFSSAVPNDDADGGNADDLYRVSVDGGEPEPLSSDPISIESELVSTDDDHLVAFSVRRQGDKEVFVANADGTGAIPVSRSARLDAFPAWRPGTGPA